MKKIYPDSSNGIATVTPINCKPITEQQYEELVERTNCAEAKADTAITCTNDLRTSLQTGLTTCTVNATAINGQEADVNKLTASCVDSDNVEANKVNTNCLTSDYAVATCANVSNLRAASACIDTLETGSFNPSTINTNDITARDIDACTVNAGSCITSPLINGTTACVSCVNSTNINNAQCFNNGGNVCIGGKTCLCGDVTANTITNKLSNTTCLDARFIEHTYCQVFDGTNADTFTVLPLFTNGHYYLEGRTDGGIKLFSIEVSNSQGNLMYRWSQKSLGYLKYVKAGTFDDGYTGKYEIAWNSNGQRINLFYQSSSTDNTEAPTSYSTTQITDEFSQHDITDLNGTYVDDLMVTDTLRVEKLEMQELAMDNVSVYENLGLTQCLVDGHPVTTSGNNLDYVQVTSCADGTTLRPSWQHPTNLNAPAGLSNTSTCLVTEKTVANYNGTSTDGVNESYNITNLGNNTCTHGNHNVECTLTANDVSVTCTITTPHFTDGGSITNGLDIQTTVDGTVISRKEGNRRDTVAAYKCECDWSNVSSTKPLSYDSTTDTIQPTDTIEVTNATAGNLTVTGDAHINGDLYVEGKTITTEEETISTSGDTIVLRQNNGSGLANTEVSGVIVHNYDGNENNAIVGVDNTGTVRIGDATGTDTTYPSIWLNADGEWFISDGTVQVYPTGELTKYASKVVDDEWTKYTNAVFTEFDLTDLEPIATRAEASAMNNHALTCWDAAATEIHTIANPTAADQILVSCANGDNTYGYRWQENVSDATKVFRFESMACYNAYTGTIPTGSIVYIDNEDNWIKSEDM